jgi:tRNA pseudouridine55 synthase
MVSALKHQGRRLYELAREGKTVARAARRVTVYDARLLGLDRGAFDLEVRCSKGTYIRTLAEDIGQALGCGAHISALRRLATGPFGASGMQDLETLEALPGQAEREAQLLPVDVLVDHLPRLEVDDGAAGRLTQGQAARVESGALGEGETTRLYLDDTFLGLGKVTGPQEVAPRRLLKTVADEREIR